MTITEKPDLRDQIYGKRKIYRGLLSISLAIICLQLYTNQVHADDFYIRGGDAAYCKLEQTTSISYRALPEQKSGAEGFEYPASSARGETGNYPPTHRFAPDLGSLVIPNVKRTLGVADSIAVPPNTTVDIGYYTHNHSGHPIIVSDAFLFTSQSDPTKGDLTRLGAGGEYGKVSWKEYGQIKSREGKVIKIPLNTTAIVDSPTFSSPGLVLYSFKTLQPIQIIDKNVEYEFNEKNELILSYTLKLHNQSSYNLPGISVQEVFPNISEYKKTVDIAPNQTISLSYEVNLGKEYSNHIKINPTKISDPNSHTENAAGQSEHTLITSRGDNGAPASWRANQPDYISTPDQARMGITLLPYTIYSRQLTKHIPSDISVIKLVSDKNEENVKINHADPEEEITYTIKVTNTGGNARDIQVIDNFDKEKVSIVDAGGGSENGGSIRWSIDQLGRNETKIFIIKAKIKAITVRGSYTAVNDVGVHYSTQLPVVDSVRTEIVVDPSLSLEKHVSDSDELLVKENHVQGGVVQEMQYSLRIKNTGNIPVSGITLRDEYDKNLITLEDTVPIDPILNIPLWHIGTLAPLETKEIRFQVATKIYLEDKTIIHNTAVVEADNTEPQIDRVRTLVNTKKQESNSTHPLPLLPDTGSNISHVITLPLIAHVVGFIIYIKMKYL